MVEILSRLNTGDLAAVLALVVIMLVVGVVVLAAQVIRAVERYREREMASSVVGHMLDRGVAPQEIIAVLKAMGLEATPEHPRETRRPQAVGGVCEKPSA